MIMKRFFDCTRNAVVSSCHSRVPWWDEQFERLVGPMKKTLLNSVENSKPMFGELKALILEIERTINDRLGNIGDIKKELMTPNLIMIDCLAGIAHFENMNSTTEKSIQVSKERTCV